MSKSLILWIFYFYTCLGFSISKHPDDFIHKTGHLQEKSSMAFPVHGRSFALNWVRFSTANFADSLGFVILSCYQRACAKLPILILGSFFQKGLICREHSTSVEQIEFMS